ncbi:MAG: dTDP-4-dehydrorhamnose reductase [Bacteroidales bacterium]|nr:dTDP-4-dehydrorhamnose reductase [Bacteroidales bacterium]
MIQKSVLVTGANGQLGSEIRLLANQYPQFAFTFTDIQELDLQDSKSIMDCFSQLKPAYLINCAAYTAVDKAENDIDLCYAINSAAVSHLALAAKQHNTTVLHVSTDYVFDGKQSRPYHESDPVCPVSVYGKSKLQGEQALNDICPTSSVIVRTAWLYSAFGNNFVKTMIRLGREKSELRVVSDQWGSPTYAADLAEALIKIILSAEAGHFSPGIYHYSNEGSCSWYEFAQKIHQLAGITSCKIIPVSTAEYPTAAQRPSYSLLDKSKIRGDYGVAVPLWTESLEACLSNFNNCK